MSAFNAYRKRSFDSANSQDSSSSQNDAGTGQAKVDAGMFGGSGKAKMDDLSDFPWQLPLHTTEHACIPQLAEMHMEKPAKAQQKSPQVDSEDHEYIRENCLVPTESLTTFADIVGSEQVLSFASQYQPTTQGAVRPISGLLLFGPPGTGKSSCAQAITHYIKGAFYKFSAADLPTGKAGANRIDALFDVAKAGHKPAVIFIDECDTILTSKAHARVGHFAGRFERFMENILVIGATNEPQNIAPRIRDGRFERKIFVDVPNAAARKALILKQLAQEETHILTPSDLFYIVEETAGRSAVNLERLVSTAVMRAGGLPVSRADFAQALEEEPNDFDLCVNAQHQKYNEKHGWRGVS